MAQTLEQQRAQYAWECVVKKQPVGRDFDKYVKASKGMPVLIMNSGLMQVLAFAGKKQEKKNENEEVAEQLRSWLCKRFPRILEKPDFNEFMQALMKAKPQDYQAINAEAFAWLKWLRQLSDARRATRQDKEE